MDSPIDLSLIMANMTMVPAFFHEGICYWTLLVIRNRIDFLFINGSIFYCRRTSKPWFLFLFTGLLYLSFFLFIIWGEIDLPYAHWTATPYHLGLMMLGILFRYEMDGDRSEVRIFGARFSSRGIFIGQLTLVIWSSTFFLDSIFYFWI